MFRRPPAFFSLAALLLLAAAAPAAFAQPKQAQAKHEKNGLEFRRGHLGSSPTARSPMDRVSG